MQSKQKLNTKAGIYLRLSKDDEKAGESLSIENQKRILEKYVQEQGFELIDTYIDDGWSGTNFNRPGVQRLLEDAKTGRINIIIVIQQSNLTVNYNYFYDRIQRSEISVDELYDAICRLEVIGIQLNQDDNPQLIFESLNSTGLALSEGDKIRNFILMGLPTKQQEDFYEKYWNRIEECTGYDVSAFIRDYLSVKQAAIPQMNRVYYTFKAFVEDNSFETETLLAELLKYARFYQILRLGNTNSTELNACIYRLNRLETAVIRPFLLEVLRMYQENVLTIGEVAQIFQISENYVFRRLICELPTNALNKIYLLLHKEILRYDGTTDQYFEKFKFAMLAKKERVRFPDDTEFAAAFSAKPMYLMNSKNKHYLFERLENFGTTESKAVWDHIDQGDYSIEHIMPQHLTPAWVEVLGENYLEIHENWLHRVANLTLTAYNSKYSNNSFADKRDMKKTNSGNFISIG